MNAGDIGKRIVAARQAINLGRYDLGAATRISPSALFAYERGMSYPGYWALHELARALGVSLNYLFGVE